MRHCRLCGGAWLTSTGGFEQHLTAMANALTPRGPDSLGIGRIQSTLLHLDTGALQ